MNNEKIEDILKNLGTETVPEDIQKIAKEASDNFSKQLSQSQKHKQHSLLEFIMKNNLTKIAAVAVIIIAVLIVFNQFDNSNVAFGQMIQNIQKAKTLVFDATFFSKDGSSGYRAMSLGEYLLRFEFSDGQVWIIDQESEEALILNPNNKTATIGSTRQEALDLYNSYANFKDLPGSTVKEVRNDEIDGKRAVAFYLEMMKGNNENDNRNVIVWADPETQLPILMKETLVVNGSVVEIIMDNIIFDEELDEALFSLDIPSGYQVIDNRNLLDRLKSGIEMNVILKSCMTYETKHGAWPNNLQELGLSGIDVSKYVYLKPSGQIDDSTIVLYQYYEVWTEGINAGFGNFQVKFIQDEVKFKSMLKQ
jgi:outer membrane lipoprotein-sorting protein